jgi:hypothetical protein
VSLLLEKGHSAARHYPVAVVWSESRIVRQRKSQDTREAAVIMQTVLGSILSKEAAKELKNLLQGMDDVG